MRKNNVNNIKNYLDYTIDIYTFKKWIGSNQNVVSVNKMKVIKA